MPRVRLSSGPYKGVHNTLDPFDTSPEYLQDALNCYILDPIGGSGLYARPGFELKNPLGALGGRGQGIYPHTSLDGVTTNFAVAGGVLYRVDSALVTYTDVSPVGVTIDPDVTHVYFASFGDSLILSDGVNPPWLASDLAATPITGAYIDFDGLGTPWSAVGRPTIYAGSVIFILNEVGGVGAQTDIAWSAPGNPAVGYQQGDYDFRWTLEQTGSSPLYAIWGTNVSFFYWRQSSIGAISGTPGPDFQTTSTHDAISVNVGTLQSATVQQYGTTIFFCDQTGRPWMMSLGNAPVPIWLSLTTVIDDATVAYPSNTAQVAVAAIEPNLDLYLAAIWSPTPAVANPPAEIQAFDTKTGEYVGRWSVYGGIAVEAIGILSNTQGSGRLVIIGSASAPPTDHGYVWVQSAIAGGEGVSFLTTESGRLLTTEAGTPITTEAVTVSWKDNERVPSILGQTPRLGYDEDTVINVDQATVITGSNSPVQITMITPNTSGVVEGTPSPSPSEDGTYRLVVGADVQGRGVQIQVVPTEAESQWVLQRIAAVAVPSKADPLDP